MTTTNNKKGFTIIEVLIVLAIAGLILLIVFLAVPALQRNSRNTQAKNEAASVLGAYSEFVNNNNGKAPTAGASSSSGSDASKILANSKLQNVTLITVENENGTTLPTSTGVVLKLGAKCTSATGANTATALGTLTDPGAGRQVALVYTIEDSSGTILACQES